MSDDETARVSVRLLDKEYQVACSISERSDLIQAAELLNRRMREIRDSGKIAGSERIAVMAALNVAHELLSVKLGSGFDLGQAKQRISAIESQLEAAIAKQEKLF